MRDLFNRIDTHGRNHDLALARIFASVHLWHLGIEAAHD
jgi:hypothetical protein